MDNEPTLPGLTDISGEPITASVTCTEQISDAAPQTPGDELEHAYLYHTHLYFNN